MFLNTDIFDDHEDESHAEFDAGSVEANEANLEDSLVKSVVTKERENKLVEQQRILRKRQTQRQSLTLSNTNTSSVSTRENCRNVLMKGASSDSAENNPKTQVENYNPAQKKRPAVGVTSRSNMRNEDVTGTLLSFVSMPYPKSFILQCKIVRSKSGWHSTYKLYMKKSSKVVIAAKRSQILKTSNYCISIEEDFIPSKSTESVICKLYSNFSGTEFTLRENIKSGLSSKD